MEPDLFVVQTVNAHVRSPDDVVVDVGCGPGKYREVLRGSYIGIDHTDAPYGAVPRVVDVVASAESLPLEDESADVVFSLSAFFLFPDHEGALREFLRVLKPDGTLLLFDYNRRTQKRLAAADRTNYPCWTALGLQRLVRRAGFERVRLLTHGTRLRSLRLLREELRGQWAIVEATKPS